MRYITILILLFILDACNKGKPERIQYKSNDKVIDFKISTAMTVDEITQLKQSEYKKISSDKFNSKTDTIKYNNNEIYISYLTFTNGCSEYAGDVDKRGDSIFLRLININGLACPEPVCDRIKFKIKNPNNKKYIIIKE